MTLKKEFEQETNFYPLYKFTCLLDTPEEMLLLNYLINADDYIENRLHDAPEYFQCNTFGFTSVSFPNWNVKNIRKYLKELERKGYIQTKIVKINMQNNTFIKLYKDKIKDLKMQYEEYLKQDHTPKKDPVIVVMSKEERERAVNN